MRSFVLCTHFAYAYTSYDLILFFVHFDFVAADLKVIPIYVLTIFGVAQKCATSNKRFDIQVAFRSNVHTAFIDMW